MAFQREISCNSEAEIRQGTEREETRQLNFTQTFAYRKLMACTQRELALVFLVKGSVSARHCHTTRNWWILQKAKLTGAVGLRVTVL